MIFKDVKFVLIKDGYDWYRIIIYNCYDKKEFRFNARENECKIILSDSNYRFNLTIMSDIDILINLSIETSNYEVMKSAEFVFGLIFSKKNKTEDKTIEIDLPPKAAADELVFITSGFNFEKIFKTGNGEVSETVKEGVFRLFKLGDSYKISIESCWKNINLKFNGSSYTHVFTSNKEIFHIFFTFDTRRIVLRGTFDDNETVSKLKGVMSQIKSTITESSPTADSSSTAEYSLTAESSSTTTQTPSTTSKAMWYRKNKNKKKKVKFFFPKNKVTKLNKNRFYTNSLPKRST